VKQSKLRGQAPYVIEAYSSFCLRSKQKYKPKVKFGLIMMDWRNV